MRTAAATVAEHGGAALAAGFDPASEEAEPHVAAILPAFGDVDRAELADRIGPAPAAGPSATGGCRRRSTAGRPCRPRCPRGSG
jgi:hypothetical protein